MLDKVKICFRNVQIKNRQRVVDKKFAEDGLTDEVLDLQLEVNMLRHEYDIADKSKLVFEDFVQ